MKDKLWVDDLRQPPGSYEWDPQRFPGQLTNDEWIWSQTSADALEVLDTIPIKIMSLDHDLGGDDTTRPIVLWLCEHPWCWPDEVRCHSANPVGREWIEGMVARYTPK